MSLTVTLVAVILSVWMTVGRCPRVEGDLSVGVNLKDGLRGTA